MKDRVILGIDPGKSGALAYRDGGEVGLFDCPLTISRYFKATKKRPKPRAKDFILDYPELVNIVSRFSSSAIAVIEEVCAYNMGSQSAFGFGANQSAWITACISHNIPIATVRPNVWKDDLGLTGQPKDASRELARSLFPSVSGSLKRIKDHDRAEALLLTYWLENYGLDLYFLNQTRSDTPQ